MELTTKVACTDEACPFTGLDPEQAVWVAGYGPVSAELGCARWHEGQWLRQQMDDLLARQLAKPPVEPPSLADTILVDDEARVAARARQEAEHHARRAHILDALRGAVGPGADPGPVNALATALSVQPAALGDVLRELLR